MLSCTSGFPPKPVPAFGEDTTSQPPGIPEQSSPPEIAKTHVADSPKIFASQEKLPITGETRSRRPFSAHVMSMRPEHRAPGFKGAHSPLCCPPDSLFCPLLGQPPTLPSPAAGQAPASSLPGSAFGASLPPPSFFPPTPPSFSENLTFPAPRKRQERLGGTTPTPGFRGHTQWGLGPPLLQEGPHS